MANLKVIGGTYLHQSESEVLLECKTRATSTWPIKVL
jgi:hypothetical protein